MTPTDRLKAIRVRHRRILRSEGEPAPLHADEIREVGRRLDAGEDKVDLAREFGCLIRQIERVRVNGRVWQGRHAYGNELTVWQRKAIEGL